MKPFGEVREKGRGRCDADANPLGISNGDFVVGGLTFAGGDLCRSGTFEEPGGEQGGCDK